MIIAGAWRTGEPGTFFIDRANEHNPVPQLGSYEATNPCGEQPLLAYDVCNLGSINLGRFVKDDARPGTDPDEAVDWDALRTGHPPGDALPGQRHRRQPLSARGDPRPGADHPACRAGRHGVGRHARAPGRSPTTPPEGVEMGRKVMEFVNEEARIRLGEAGRDARRLPGLGGVDLGPEGQGRRARGRRAGASRAGAAQLQPDDGGAHRHDLDLRRLLRAASSRCSPWRSCATRPAAMMPDVNPDFVRLAEEQGWYSPELMERIAEEGHIHFDEVPEDVQRVFRTAHDITPEWHVRMQAAFQEHCDSAISKTTNFAHEATEEDVRQIYQLAFELGCKGVTVYRDGSRQGQVLSTGKTGKGEAGAEASAQVSELEQQLADAREEAHNLRVRDRADEARGGGARPDGRRRAPQAAASAGAPGPHHEDDVPARRPVRDGQRGRLGPSVRGVLHARQGGRRGHGRRRGAWAGSSRWRCARGSRSRRSRLSSGASRATAPWASDPTRFCRHRTRSARPSSATWRRRTACRKRFHWRSRPRRPAPRSCRRRPPSTAARSESFLGACPECGAGQLAYEEGCMKCHVCGYSECG